MPSELLLEFEYKNQRFADAEAGLRAFAGDFGKSVDKMPAVLRRELKNMLDTVAKAMEERHSASWSPGARGPEGEKGGKLFKRSGRLLREITESVRVDGTTFETIEGRIGGGLYAPTHEYGATITARRAKYLTIPLPAALDARGVPKKRSARDWPNTFVLKSKKGNLLIVQKVRGRLVPLYVLKRSVRIPPRLGLGATLTAAVPVFVDRLFDKLLKEITAGVG